MEYKYFNLIILSYISGIILMSVVLGWTIAINANTGFIISIIILLVILIINFVFFIRKPLKRIYQFFLALKCNDSTIRFDKVNDPLLGEIYEEMNNIVIESNKKKLEIETKKSFYDRILKIMTHEIRNTITPIVSCTEHIIKKNKERSEEANREELNVILNQSRNIVDFLDSYHTLTHLPEPEFSRLNVKSLCEEMLIFLRNEKGGDRMNFFVPEMEIYADKVQMQLILGNVLRNALQAIDNIEDGEVELRASINHSSQLLIMDLEL